MNIGDSPVGVPCPKCGAEIVYNGNYFCSNWQYPLLDDTGCDWALSNNDNGKPVGRRDKEVWSKIQTSDFFLKEKYGEIEQ